ncbi:MAG: HAD family phosphatase, partial [Candidatus Ornithomonoglobus sp.]
MIDYKGAIFDLDGTLLDSMCVWDKVDREFFSSRNIVMPEDYTKIIAPMGFVRAAEYTIERFSLRQSVAEILNEWNSIAFRHYSTDIALKKNA